MQNSKAMASNWRWHSRLGVVGLSRHGGPKTTISSNPYDNFNHHTLARALTIGLEWMPDGVLFAFEPPRSGTTQAERFGVVAYDQRFAERKPQHSPVGARLGLCRRREQPLDSIL